MTKTNIESENAIKSSSDAYVNEIDLSDKVERSFNYTSNYSHKEFWFSPSFKYKEKPIEANKKQLKEISE